MRKADRHTPVLDQCVEHVNRSTGRHTHTHTHRERERESDSEELQEQFRRYQLKHVYILSHHLFYPPFLISAVHFNSSAVKS